MKDHICPTCMGWLLDYKTLYKKCVSCGFTTRKKECLSITKSELLKGRDQQFPDDYTEEVSNNLDELLIVLNKVRDAYGKPLIVNSGWRPPSINAKTPGAANHSLHEEGLACDFADADGSLWAWVMDNLQLMKDLGIWLEDKRWTPSWTHMGIRPPKSGHRIFVPSSAPALAPDQFDGVYDHKFD